MDIVLLNNIIETCVTSPVILLAAVTNNMLFEDIILFGVCTFAFRCGREFTEGNTFIIYVCLCTWNSSSPTRRIFMKFDI